MSADGTPDFFSSSFLDSGRADVSDRELGACRTKLCAASDSEDADEDLPKCVSCERAFSIAAERAPKTLPCQHLCCFECVLASMCGPVVTCAECGAEHRLQTGEDACAPVGDVTSMQRELASLLPTCVLVAELLELRPPTSGVCASRELSASQSSQISVTGPRMVPDTVARPEIDARESCVEALSSDTAALEPRRNGPDDTWSFENDDQFGFDAKLTSMPLKFTMRTKKLAHHDAGVAPKESLADASPSASRTLADDDDDLTLNQRRQQAQCRPQQQAEDDSNNSAGVAFMGKNAEVILKKHDDSEPVQPRSSCRPQRQHKQVQRIRSSDLVKSSVMHVNPAHESASSTTKLDNGLNANPMPESPELDVPISRLYPKVKLATSQAENDDDDDLTLDQRRQRALQQQQQLALQRPSQVEGGEGMMARVQTEGHDTTSTIASKPRKMNVDDCGEAEGDGSRGRWKNAWENSFRLLLAYKERFGHACPTQHETFEGANLGRWVQNQRYFASKGQVQDQRVSRLQAMGFMFTGPEAMRQRKIAEQKQENSTPDVLPEETGQQGAQLAVTSRDALSCKLLETDYTRLEQHVRDKKAKGAQPQVIEAFVEGVEDQSRQIELNRCKSFLIDPPSEVRNEKADKVAGESQQPQDPANDHVDVEISPSPDCDSKRQRHLTRGKTVCFDLSQPTPRKDLASVMDSASDVTHVVVANKKMEMYKKIVSSSGVNAAGSRHEGQGKTIEDRRHRLALAGARFGKKMLVRTFAARETFSGEEQAGEGTVSNTPRGICDGGLDSCASSGPAGNSCSAARGNAAKLATDVPGEQIKTDVGHAQIARFSGLASYETLESNHTPTSVLGQHFRSFSSSVFCQGDGVEKEEQRMYDTEAEVASMMTSVDERQPSAMQRYEDIAAGESDGETLQQKQVPTADEDCDLKETNVGKVDESQSLAVAADCHASSDRTLQKRRRMGPCLSMCCENQTKTSSTDIPAGKLKHADENLLSDHAKGHEGPSLVSPITPDTLHKPNAKATGAGAESTPRRQSGRSNFGMVPVKWWLTSPGTRGAQDSHKCPLLPRQADQAPDSDTKLSEWCRSASLTSFDDSSGPPSPAVVRTGKRSREAAGDITALRLLQLEKFKHEHGHVHVRQNHVFETGESALFLTTWRTQYRAGKMEEPLRRRLNQLGFEWDAKKARSAREALLAQV